MKYVLGKKRRYESTTTHQPSCRSNSRLLSSNSRPFSNSSRSFSSNSSTPRSSNSSSNSFRTKAHEIVSPKWDNFAKRKNKDVEIIETYDKKLVESSDKISSFLTSVVTKTNNSTSGSFKLIEERLGRISENKKTQCIIEIFQIIQKYED